MVIIGKSTTKLKPRNNSQLSKLHQPPTCQTGAERGGGRELAGKPRGAKLSMENAPVTAATGALGPVIAKLAALLGSEYKLRWHTRRDVKFIRSKLKPVHSILWNIWEREELDEASMELKMEALDLADELDDAIFDFILSLERSRSNKRFVQTKIKASPFHNLKKRASDVSVRCHSRWKEKEKDNEKEKKKKPAATTDSGPGKPRAYPFIRKDASELVGMAEQRDKLIQHLFREDETTPAELQLKIAFIYGTAGMGKTTLADLVYEAIGDKFESRAFVSITRPGVNRREVLATILQHVAPNTSEHLAGTEAATEEEHLINIISNFLKDKRYLVIIDDIWNVRECEVIMKSLPESNLGSRIVGTTRIKSVNEKWCIDFDWPNALLHEMLPEWNKHEEWVYRIGEENIVGRMIDMDSDLVAKGLNYWHPVVRMCGGTPLAVLCMLSAVAKEREKHVKYAKLYVVQDEIEKHVMENGIQNTPGFEPLVESLQLSYDDLPHHMLKTCLLYCSIYPGSHTFESHDLVRRWVSEGFACNGEEGNSYFQELINRGLIMGLPYDIRMHPMMRNFLRLKSRQENFITCSSEITPSCNTWSIRRICIDNPAYNNTHAADNLSALDWYRIRSLVVYEDIKRVPFEKLQGVRLLDLCSIRHLVDQHLNDICGLVRLRHLLGLNEHRISDIPPGIVSLQCLETFEVKENGFSQLDFIRNMHKLRWNRTQMPKVIWSLQQLKTLDMSRTQITELPKEVVSLQQLRTLDVSRTKITVLPKEIRELQQLRTLDVSRTEITVLPKEIRELQQLRTLDISRTEITVLPKEIRELQHLEHLLMTDTKVLKIPREIGTLKELKSLKIGDSITALPLEVGAFEVLPECIRQAIKSGVVSELAVEMLSFRNSRLPYEYVDRADIGGLVVGAKQMHMPPWIREHFNDLAMLDIRICRLEEGGLKILREMPRLESLTIRFEVVPREPVLISSVGFKTLSYLTVDCRVPRVTFQEGAMPNLMLLTFEFQFYAGQPTKDPVGINHFRRLRHINFVCNEDGYGGGDSPCIRPTIDVVRKEAQDLPSLLTFKVCGIQEDIYSPPPSPPPPLEMEEEEEELWWG